MKKCEHYFFQRKYQHVFLRQSLMSNVTLTDYTRVNKQDMAAAKMTLLAKAKLNENIQENTKERRKQEMKRRNEERRKKSRSLKVEKEMTNKSEKYFVK